MSSFFITQRDIAKALGLTQAAVSLALRNHPTVSAATRKQVHLKAQELGYEYNSSAVALSHFKRTSVSQPIKAALAWLNIWSEPAHLYSFNEFVLYKKGAESCARKYGYRLEEFSIRSVSPKHLERVLHSRGIEGILLSPCDTPPDFDDFNWSRFSVVRFGRTWPTPQTDFVTSDQLGNSLLAFDAIRARGYKRPGWVQALNSSHFRAHLHEAGVMMARRELSATHQVPTLELDLCDTPSVHGKLARWLKENKPDAIFSDYSGITRLVREAGFRVPEDIAVAGTTVLDTDAKAGIDQRPQEIGRTAMLMLISLMSDNAKGIPAYVRQVLIPGMWVDDASLPYRPHSE